MSKLKKVFLVRGPTRRIREVDAEIIVCEKFTWAKLKNGKRHLLGATAFFKRNNAEQMKLGHLRKVAEGTNLSGVANWGLRLAYAEACKQYREYKETGVIH